jgi:hypothetical protein
MTTAAQYQRWAANARAMASDLSDGPTRDALLYVARSHEHEAYGLKALKIARMPPTD